MIDIYYAVCYNQAEGGFFMNLERLQCFIETVRCGTITEAAHKLYMAQPNLSRQISLLEEELGYKLFVREHRRLKLTSAGAYLFDEIQDIPDRLTRACRQAGELSRQAQTVITIGLMESEQLLPALVDRFHQFQERHPEITISFERGDFEALRQGLQNDQLDFIFTFAFEAEAMEDVNYHIMLRQKPALAISVKHPLAQKDELTFADLKDVPFVALNSRQSAESYRISAETYAEAGFKPNIIRYTYSSEQLLLLVEIGAGATVVDENSRISSSPNVRIYPIPNASRNPDLCLAWKSNKALRPAKALFIQEMTSTLSSESGESVP